MDRQSITVIHKHTLMQDCCHLLGPININTCELRVGVEHFLLQLGEKKCCCSGAPLASADLEQQMNWERETQDTLDPLVSFMTRNRLRT